MSRIRTIKPEGTDEAAFAGLFFGEGHIDLVKQGSTTRGLSVRLRIALRDDDRAVLDWVASLYGGCLYRREATRSWCWQLTGRERVLAALRALESSPVPSKKKREVALAIEAVHLTPQRGRHLTDQAAQAMLDLRSRLKGERVYGAH